MGFLHRVLDVQRNNNNNQVAAQVPTPHTYISHGFTLHDALLVTAIAPALILIPPALL